MDAPPIAKKFMGEDSDKRADRESSVGIGLLAKRAYALQRTSKSK